MSSVQRRSRSPVGPLYLDRARCKTNLRPAVPIYRPTMHYVHRRPPYQKRIGTKRPKTSREPSIRICCPPPRLARAVSRRIALILPGSVKADVRCNNSAAPLSIVGGATSRQLADRMAADAELPIPNERPWSSSGRHWRALNAVSTPIVHGPSGTTDVRRDERTALNIDPSTCGVHYIGGSRNCTGCGRGSSPGGTISIGGPTGVREQGCAPGSGLLLS